MKGFTLIELMIGVSLSLLITGTIVFSMVHMTALQKRIALSASSSGNALSALGSIGMDIKSASEISPYSDENRLILCQGPDIISYEFSSGKVKKTNNGYVQYISADGKIKSLRFSYSPSGIVSIFMCPEKTASIITSEAFPRNTAK